MRFAFSGKRVLDVIGSVVGLLLTSPLQGAIAAAVLLTDGRPVLFRQPRPGLDGEIFSIIKFRTMTCLVSTDDEQHDGRRITSLGKVLRSTSLDELPELWNVLLGQMSLVGPRPLLVEYLQLYSSDQSRRHDVRPGITGLAQVAGRNAVGWDERLALDVEYVVHHSLSMDAVILWKTAITVATRHGISAEGHVTMPHFRGSHGIVTTEHAEPPV